MWQDSLSFWNDALRHDADNTFALIDRAACLINDKEIRQRYGISEALAYRQALKDLQKASRRAPRDVDVWKDLAIVYKRLGRMEESAAAHIKFEQLLKVGL